MGSFMEVRIVGFVPEIINRVGTHSLCEELYSVHMLGNIGP